MRIPLGCFWGCIAGGVFFLTTNHTKEHERGGCLYFLGGGFFSTDHTEWGGLFLWGDCFFTTNHTNEHERGGCLYFIIGHDHQFIQLYFIANFTGFLPFISNDFSIFIQYHPSVQNFNERALPVLRTVVVGATIVVGATVLVALREVKVCSLATDVHGCNGCRGGGSYFLGGAVKT